MKCLGCHRCLKGQFTTQSLISVFLWAVESTHLNSSHCEVYRLKIDSSFCQQLIQGQLGVFGTFRRCLINLLLNLRCIL